MVGPMSVDSTEDLKYSGKHFVSILNTCRLSSCPSLSHTIIYTAFHCAGYASNIEIESQWVDLMGYVQTYHL